MQGEKGEDMRQRTRTQAGLCQPYGMWSPAQRTELNLRQSPHLRFILGPNSVFVLNTLSNISDMTPK